MQRLETLRNVPTWRRVAAATWSTADDPSIYGWIDIDATALQTYVAALRAQTGQHITLTHVVGKAVAMAFAQNPDANALLSFGRMKRRTSVDVFFSVAVADGKNLSGAKICHADKCSVADIANRLRRKVERIRTCRDTPLQKSQSMMKRLPGLLMKPVMRATTALMFDLGLDLTAVGVPFDPLGSVIVTNVGVLGVEQGFAPLMPQSRTPALFTIGKVRDKVIAINGQPVVRPVLTLGGTFDHRIVDGAHLGTISTTLKRILEHPARHLDPLATSSSTVEPDLPSAAHCAICRPCASPTPSPSPSRPSSPSLPVPAAATMSSTTTSRAVS